MKGVQREEGFQLRRDANFLLDSDRCLTAVGAPVVLARNYAGYASLGRSRQGRWGIGDKEETPFKMASAFLKDRHEICVPVELLAGLIDEDSKLRSSARSGDMPDTVCSDLSWPGSCLENLTAGNLDAGSHYPPLLVHTSGPQNSHLALLRPRPPRFASTTAVGRRSSGGVAGARTAAVPCGLDPEAAAAAAAVAAVTTNASAAIELEDRLALHAGPIRQISLAASRAGAPPRVFARCDYSATLVGACKIVDRLRHPAARNSRAVYERRIRRAKVAAGVPIAVDDAAALAAAEAGAAANGGVGGVVMVEEEEEEEEDVDEGFDFDGFVEEEKLVFGKRLTCAACSPYTPKHAAFLDEEFRLFQWHSDRGAATHGPGPLPIPTPVAAAEHPRSEAEARRSRNADVAVDYGSHPRVLWIAGRHRAYRIDLRQKPSPAALKPALEPGVYYKSFSKNQIVEGGCGKLGGRGEEPRIRSLAVGRRSVYDLFVAAGLHLAYMDARFPRGVVARWDLPQEVDQLRWLPGLPGEGHDAEEIVLASGRRSPGYYVNTWARDSPGWRGCEARLGLDDTSPAASAARRPLTFSLPATPLSEGETRSGGLMLALPREARRTGGGDIWFVNATSAGDAYGQRLKLSQIGGASEGKGVNGRTSDGDGKTAVPATPRSELLCERIQSMLPCGDVCLDPDDATFHPPARPKTATTKKTRESNATATGKTKSATRDDPGMGTNDRRRRRGAVSERDDDSAAGDGSSSGNSNISSASASGEDSGGWSDSGGSRGPGRKEGRRRGDKGTRRIQSSSKGGGGDGLEISAGEGADGDSGDDSGGSRGGSHRSSKRSTRAGSRKVRSSKGDTCDKDNTIEGKKTTAGSEDKSSGRRDSSDGRGGPALLQLSPSKGTKRPRRDETRRKASHTNNSNAAPSDTDHVVGGSGGDNGGGERHGMKPANYFPVNAGALRAAVEEVPDNALCGHRHLAPLVDLVSAGKCNDGASGGEESPESFIAAGATSAAAQQRERDFGDLRDRKADVADFLLKPRTPEELLTFCRRTLGLGFPSDPPAGPAFPGRQPGVTNNGQEDNGTETIIPPASNGLGGDSRSRRPTSSIAVDNKSNTSSSSGGSSNVNKRRRRFTDAKVAVDVAIAVLAWGKPFRNIETAWRAAAVGQSYSMVSSLQPRPLPPTISTLVLCSAREVLKGEPSPFLRPGTVGPPLAVDVTVEDVRWLKDEWDTSW